MVRNNRFLGKQYFLALFPVMFSILAGTINTLIDSVFVVQKLGSEGLAAVNMCGPVYQIICTLGALCAGGSSILSAQAEGKNDFQRSRRYYQTSFTMCIIIGGLFCGAGIIFGKQIAYQLAQGGSLFEYVYDYCIVTFIGLLPIALAYIPLYYLQLAGRVKDIVIMMCLVIGIDLVLDWLFLFCFDLGMRGAATASVISMAISFLYGFLILEKYSDSYRLSVKKIRLDECRDILIYGSPAAVGNFFDAIRLFLLNAIILNVGGTAAIAVWAVLNSLSELSLSFVAGIPQTAAPMIGVFYTSGENSAIHILMKIQLKAGMVLLAVYGGMLLILQKGLEELFAIPQSLLLPILCLVISILFEILCSIWGSFFNDTNRIMLSNLLMVGRTFVFPLGAILLLVYCHGYIWLFLPLGGLLTIFGMLVCTGRIYKKNKNQKHSLSRFLLLDEYLEKENLVLDFSISPTVQNICDASEKIKDFCSINDMDEKATIRLGLAIEELLVVMKEQIKNMNSVDLRAFVSDNITGIQIRCAGEKYNPFEEAGKAEDEDYYMGVTMLHRMALEVIHNYTLGMNTIYFSFVFEKKVKGAYEKNNK